MNKIRVGKLYGTWFVHVPDTSNPTSRDVQVFGSWSDALARALRVADFQRHALRVQARRNGEATS